MNINKVRSSFEAWASSSPMEWCLDRRPESSAWPGQYREHHVQCSWEVWELGAEQREAMATVIKEVMEWHRDEQSPDYAGCDTDPCQWCAHAEQALGAFV